MAHNPLHVVKKNPNPVVKKVTVRPFGPKVFGTPVVVKKGNTTTTTTPYTQTRQSTGVTYQEAYKKAGGQSGTGMSFPGFKKAAINYNTRTGSVVKVEKKSTAPPRVARVAPLSLKPAGPVKMGSGPKANPIIPISTGPSPITSPKIKQQEVMPKVITKAKNKIELGSGPKLNPKSRPKKKRKPFRPLGRRPFEPGGTISNITRGIGYAAGDVGRTVGNVAVGAVTLPFKAIGGIFKGGCGRGKCNPMAKNIFGKRKIRRR